MGRIPCLVMLLLALTWSDYAFSQTTFTESAAAYGIDLDGNKEGGHAWADYDLDGDLDLLVNTDHGVYCSRLFRNDGGSFFDVTSVLAPNLLNDNLERSAAWGDLNSDGFPDFIRNTSGEIQVYLQDPNTGLFGDGMGGS
ncbi:MAG: hypothetical protein HKN32_04860, partial [Flavobacteriales bacterium]|nr:hypothetical protein [Flavobacteriales bacterium]